MPPPSLADKGSYRFLPPFFEPPFLAVFLAMRYPPLRMGLVARSSHCVAAPRHQHAGLLCQRSRLVAYPTGALAPAEATAARSERWSHSTPACRGRPAAKKRGCRRRHPRTGTRISASCRPFSRRPFSIRPFSPFFLLGMLAAQLRFR